MNHIDSLETDPRRGSKTVDRPKNQSFIPVGDANRNYATATRLKNKIYHLSYRSGFPTGISNMENETPGFNFRNEVKKQIK